MLHARFVRVAMLVAAFTTVGIVSSARRAGAATPPPSPRFHLALLKAEPAKNDTVSATPKAIKLWFTESVQASATSIRVTGPAAHVVSLGTATVDTKEKSPAVFPVNETLKPGSYSVAWKTMASDGHPSSGTFAFVVKTAAPKAGK